MAGDRMGAVEGLGAATALDKKTEHLAYLAVLAAFSRYPRRSPRTTPPEASASGDTNRVLDRCR